MDEPSEQPVKSQTQHSNRATTRCNYSYLSQSSSLRDKRTGLWLVRLLIVVNAHEVTTQRTSLCSTGCPLWGTATRLSFTRLLVRDSTSTSYTKLQPTVPSGEEWVPRNLCQPRSVRLPRTRDPASAVPEKVVQNFSLQFIMLIATTA